MTNQRRNYVNQKSPSGGWKSFIQGNKVSAYIAAGPDHWLWRTNEVKWEWHCASLLVAAQGVNWRAQSHGRLHYGDRRQLWAGWGRGDQLRDKGETNSWLSTHYTVKSIRTSLRSLQYLHMINYKEDRRWNTLWFWVELPLRQSQILICIICSIYQFHFFRKYCRSIIYMLTNCNSFVFYDLCIYPKRGPMPHASNKKKYF